MQALRQSRLAAAAQPVAHHHDVLHLQELDCEFERGRNAVLTLAGLVGGNHRRDIADDEDLAGVDIEDLRRIDSAVGAGDHHHLGLLAIAQLFPAGMLRFPGAAAEALVAFDQFVIALHGFNSCRAALPMASAMPKWATT